MLNTLIPWRPFRSLTPVWNWDWPWLEEEKDWMTFPRVETHVEGNVLTIKADLPGMNPKEVELSVTGNRLTIKGERKADEKHEEGKTFRHEVRYGAFARTLTLPAEVEAEKITASYHEGVLEVTVPLPEAVVPKKVTVEVAEETPENLLGAAIMGGEAA